MKAFEGLMLNFNFKYLALCGIIAPLIAYTFIALAIMQMPQFSWTQNALSDLGVWKNSALTFNLGLMLAALIQITFAASLCRYFNKPLGRIGVIIYLISSIALLLIGVYPESAGRIHFYVALSFFTLAPIYLIFLAASLIKECGEFSFGIITIFLAILAILPWLLYLQVLNVSGVAIPELLSTIPASIWNITTAIKLYRKAS